MRRAEVWYKERLAGYLTQDELGYHFEYDLGYINEPGSEPVSLTFPLKNRVYNSNTLFPFFDGLIPEGWLLDIAEKNWKLNQRDRMGLLMVCCNDCIGAVSIIDKREGAV